MNMSKVTTRPFAVDSGVLNSTNPRSPKSSNVRRSTPCPAGSGRLPLTPPICPDGQAGSEPPALEVAAVRQAAPLSFAKRVQPVAVAPVNGSLSKPAAQLSDATNSATLSPSATAAAHDLAVQRRSL